MASGARFRCKQKEAQTILNGNNLTPLEQITEVWEQYIAAVVQAGMRISPSQATELAVLAAQLARLHEQEAAECHRRARFWRTYEPPV